MNRVSNSIPPTTQRSNIGRDASLNAAVCFVQRAKAVFRRQSASGRFSLRGQLPAVDFANSSSSALASRKSAVSKPLGELAIDLRQQTLCFLLFTLSLIEARQAHHSA